MYRPRIIPVLLLKERGLVKTIRFQEPTYVGDPMNAVRIFNDLEADELIFLDITASKKGRVIKTEFVKAVGDEAFMPFSVGGGITSIEQIREVIQHGAEKAILNTAAVNTPGLIKKASDEVGTQAIVVSLDVKRQADGSYEIFTYGGTKATGMDPVELAVKIEKLGAGEILINSMDRDGTREGYDIYLIQKISNAISIPVIALGGAGSEEDFVMAAKLGNASAVAAGSMFVFVGRKRGVLINYPEQEELQEIFTCHI